MYAYKANVKGKKCFTVGKYNLPKVNIFMQSEKGDSVMRVCIDVQVRVLTL